jgi:hypothetical protein
MFLAFLSRQNRERARVAHRRHLATRSGQENRRFAFHEAYVV